VRGDAPRVGVPVYEELDHRGRVHGAADVQELEERPHLSREREKPRGEEKGWGSWGSPHDRSVCHPGGEPPTALDDGRDRDPPGPPRFPSRLPVPTYGSMIPRW
jgi:hypothetical protein